MRLATYGKREIVAGTLVLVLGAVLSGLFFLYAVPVFIFLLIWLLWFFRDPERPIPAEPRILVAPADGRVVEIAEVGGGLCPYLGGPATRIAIFLSIFDCHVNRSPAAATVEQVAYRPGRFHLAWKPEASAENECAEVGLALAEGGGRILVRQIAGGIARRIVCACREGQGLRRGERIGMIKFGSRTEVLIPSSLGFRPRVQVGTRVRAGVTILGEFR